MNEIEHASAPRRPGVVTAAAVLLYVFAGFGLLGTLLLAGIASSMPGEASVVMLVNLGLCIAYLVLATLILGGSHAAKVTTIVLLSIGIVVDLVGITGRSLLSVALALLVIGLLAWNRDANEFFARHR